MIFKIRQIKFYLLLIIIAILYSNCYAQIFSKDQQQYEKDIFTKKKIRCFVEEITEFSKTDSLNNRLQYDVTLIDSLGNTLYIIHYSSKEIIENIEIFIFEKDKLRKSKLCYTDNYLTKKFVENYNQNGDLIEFIQFDKNAVLITKSVYTLNKLNNYVKCEVFGDKDDLKIITYYKYNSNNHIKDCSTIYTSSPKKIHSKTFLKYDTNNKLISRITKNYSYNIIYKHKYQYNTEGLLIKQDNYINNIRTFSTTIIYFNDIKQLIDNYHFKMPDLNKFN